MMGDISEVERKDKTSHLRNIIVTANTSLGYPYNVHQQQELQKLQQQQQQQQQQQSQQKYPGTPSANMGAPHTQSNFQELK